jgi:hypothetical protein
MSKREGESNRQGRTSKAKAKCGSSRTGSEVTVKRGPSPFSVESFAIHTRISLRFEVETERKVIVKLD